MDPPKQSNEGTAGIPRHNVTEALARTPVRRRVLDHANAVVRRPREGVGDRQRRVTARLLRRRPTAAMPIFLVRQSSPGRSAGRFAGSRQGQHGLRGDQTRGRGEEERRRKRRIVEFVYSAHFFVRIDFSSLGGVF